MLKTKVKKLPVSPKKNNSIESKQEVVGKFDNSKDIIEFYKNKLNFLETKLLK